METNRYLVFYWQRNNDEWEDREQFIYAYTEEDAIKIMVSINPLARNIEASLWK